MEQLKTCGKCKKQLPLSSFYKHPTARDRLQSTCKACAKLRTPEQKKRQLEYGKQWRERNEGKSKKYYQKRKIEVIESAKNRQAANRARTYVSIPATKVCFRCKQLLGADIFNTNPGNTDGLDCYCKPCRSAYGAERRLNNHAAIIAKERAKYAALSAADRKALNIRNREHAKTEEAKAKHRAWKRKNAEKYNAMERARRKANPEKNKQQCLERYRKKRAAELARRAADKLANPEKYLEKEKIKNARLSAAKKIYRLRQYAKRKLEHTANPEPFREKARRSEAERRKRISDGYIRGMLSKDGKTVLMPRSTIPQSLVDLKRAQVLIVRELRSKKK